MGLYSDLNFNNGEYIQQYVGAPLEEIKQAADTLSNRHYSNLANLDAIGILGAKLKSEALPGAKPYFDTHLNSINEAFQDLSKRGAENATPKVMSIASAFRKDQGILNALERSKEYAKQTALLDEMKAKGLRPAYDAERRSRMEQATADSDLYKTPYEARVEPYEDYIKDFDEVMSAVKPDKKLIEALGPEQFNSLVAKINASKDPTGKINMPLFLKAVERSDISETKIRGLIDELYTSYKGKPSYKQQTATDLGPEFGKKDLPLQEELLNRALQYVYQQDDTTYQSIGSLAGLGLGKGLPADPGGLYFGDAPVQPLTGPQVQKLEEGIIGLKNMIKNTPVESKERQRLQSYLNLEEQKLGDIRTTIEKEFNMEEKFKEFKPLIDKLTTDNYRSDIYPTNQEEFNDWIRAGKRAEILTGREAPSQSESISALRKLNNLEYEYANRKKVVEKDLKLSSQYSIPNINNPIIEQEMKDVNSTAHTTGWEVLGANATQLNEDLIKEENSNIDLDKNVRVPGEDQYIPSYASIDGRPVTHFVPAYKPKNGTEKEVFYGTARAVTPQNTEEAQKKMFRIGALLSANGYEAGTKYKAAARLSSSFDPLGVDFATSIIPYMPYPDENGNGETYQILPKGEPGSPNRHYELLYPNGKSKQIATNLADLKAYIYKDIFKE